MNKGIILAKLVIPFLVLASFTIAHAQNDSLTCVNLLKKGQLFKIESPKSLEGIYKFIVLPSKLNKHGKTATGKLYLIWEKNYYEMLKSEYPSQKLLSFPLVGFAIGDYNNITISNWNADKLSQTDPLNPGLRYLPKRNTLISPGGKIVLPNCNYCHVIPPVSLDSPMLSFHFEKTYKGILIGKWSKDFGSLVLKISPGKSIRKVTGYFCAMPITNE